MTARPHPPGMAGADRDGELARRTSTAPALCRWRQGLTWAFGLLWLLDAALQYQPYMFTVQFPDQAIAAAGRGSPGLVGEPVTWAAHLMAGNPVVFNAIFATIQLAIAAGLFWRPTVKLALAGSIIWSLLVWWLGEGLGGVLAGPVSPVAGLPGAVVLYAIIAILLWPPQPGPDRTTVGSLATGSPLRPAGAKLTWLLLWSAFAAEAVRAPAALHEVPGSLAAGEPRWIAGMNTASAAFFAHDATPAAIALAVTCALIGLSVLTPAATRPGVILAMVLALAIWVIGEDFGQIATGTATDPNSGLPLAILALCYWPFARRLPRSMTRRSWRGHGRVSGSTAVLLSAAPAATQLLTSAATPTSPAAC